MVMVLPTVTAEETRDAIVKWLASEAEFHRNTARFCSGVRAKKARVAEADLIASLAASLSQYKTRAEIQAAE